MTAGLVLAAGAGTRFGVEPKQLADLDGRPLLEHVVRAACAVPALERVVVVLGASAVDVRARVVLGRAEAVVCEDWEDGQAASLRCGLRALAGAAKVVLVLGDQPLLSPALIARFAAAPVGTRAAYGGRPGHPAVLGPEQVAAALGLAGDSGLRDLPWRLVDCGRDASDRDVDTPEDLEAIRHEARAVL